MRLLIAVAALASLALPAAAEANTLNKCIDAQGKVTYSNLPCRNAREVREVEIDPPPLPDPVRAAPPPVAKPTPAEARPKPAAKPKPAPAVEVIPPIQVENRQVPVKPAAQASARQCDTLTDKLGRVFDKMDQARRKGYTLEQMEKWNLEVKDLERQKQQSGCF